MKKLVYWVIAIVLLGCGFGAGMYINRARHPEEAPAEVVAKPEPLHLELTPSEVEAAGIKAEPIQAGTLTPEAVLFGVLQEDPGESFTIRAPAAGTLKKENGRSWPVLGEVLGDQVTIGELQPRLVPSDEVAIAAERVTLETQVATAQADVNAATVALTSARASYERVKKLFDQDQNVSARVVEEEQAKVKTEEAHLEGAKQSLAVAKSALSSVEIKPHSQALVVVHGGEVVEIGAQPEESVESGQAVLRVARLDHLLAAVNVPMGQAMPGGAGARGGGGGGEARIVVMNEEATPLSATRVASASAVDPKTKDSVIMYRVALAASSSTIRPGIPVTAYVPLGGEALKGVIVPRSAVVRYGGRAWVYLWGAEVERGKEKKRDFERREIALEHPAPDGQGWFVMEKFKADEKVVTTGAAMLLSTETNTFGGG